MRANVLKLVEFIADKVSLSYDNTLGKIETVGLQTPSEGLLQMPIKGKEKGKNARERCNLRPWFQGKPGDKVMGDTMNSSGTMGN